MIGSLAVCSWFQNDSNNASRLSTDEKVHTKSLLCGLKKLDTAARETFPLALFGLAGWTVIWLYRGYKYPSVRGKVPLHNYIDKTFLVAKTFGVATFLAGSVWALRELADEEPAEHEQQKEE